MTAWLPFIRTHVKPAQAVAGVAMAIAALTLLPFLILTLEAFCG